MKTWKACSAILLGLLACEWASQAIAADQGGDKDTIWVDDDATVHMPAYAIPFSGFASPEAKAAFLELARHPFPVTSPDPVKVREVMNQAFYIPAVKHALDKFPVKLEENTEIDGVKVDIVTPIDGVSPQNKNRVLINLHGGAFMLGAHWGGELESISIAHDGRIKIITVDYREFPEYKFPAGTEDVVKVYKKLLNDYRPENIGIFGSSAGGILTAEVVVALMKNNLPLPGAIGIFSAAAGGLDQGDSLFSWPLVGNRPPSPDKIKNGSRVGYFADADMRSADVAPVYHPDLLKKFPPSLILTGTRDVAMSAGLFTHREMVKAGVDAELHVWEGLGHSVYENIDLPESRDFRDVVVRFFDRHLGRKAK